MSDHALRGRAGLVTGASRGMGRAIALALATEGVALALVGRDKARLVNIAQEARMAGAPMVTPLLVDLADEVGVRAAAATVAHMFDKLDLLVHSAGAYERESGDTVLRSAWGYWVPRIRVAFAGDHSGERNLVAGQTRPESALMIRPGCVI
jgi:NADP-dependent 3-hydroxy acid dehydrogenase YdfG